MCYIIHKTSTFLAVDTQRSSKLWYLQSPITSMNLKPCNVWCTEPSYSIHFFYTKLSLAFLILSPARIVRNYRSSYRSHFLQTENKYLTIILPDANLCLRNSCTWDCGWLDTHNLKFEGTSSLCHRPILLNGKWYNFVWHYILFYCLQASSFHFFFYKMYCELYCW